MAVRGDEQIWRTDAPPTNQVVEVWFWNRIIHAFWDGAEWRTVEGARLAGITHWRREK